MQLENSGRITFPLKNFYRISVCKQSIEELKKAIGSVDPSKKIDVGGYHLDAEGNYRSSKVISATQSEVLLSEMIDQICDKMENYVRATWKSNGTLTLLNLLDSSGAMNAKMSEVDIIQDDDLNKSLQYYVSCSSHIFLCPYRIILTLN